MKKGFTLAELLGVIVILAALLLISIPVVDKIIKQSQEDLYNKQIDSIKLAMNLWISDKYKLNEGESIALTLSQLKEEGLVEFDITNPITKELFPNDMILTIENKEGQLEYNVSDEGTNIENYENIPRISINGNVLTYVEINTEYIEKDVVATDNNGNIITSTKSFEPQLNTSLKGTYLEKYTVNNNGHTNFVYRTIIVRDTIGPEIIFSNNLVLTYEQAESYDFESDIIVRDNSGDNVEIVIEDNITILPGEYTVKYTAKDSSGNETTKLRKVTIKE